MGKVDEALAEFEEGQQRRREGKMQAIMDGVVSKSSDRPRRRRRVADEDNLFGEGASDEGAASP